MDLPFRTVPIPPLRETAIGVMGSSRTDAMQGGLPSCDRGAATHDSAGPASIGGADGQFPAILLPSVRCSGQAG
jgi:hypothetical protein